MSGFRPQRAQAVDGEITYTGTNTNLTGDDVGAGPFNLGFTFNFYGSDFTQTYININGTINFSENYSRYNNVPLSTAQSGTDISNYSIYAFWDDLNTNPSGGSGNKPIYYGTVGTAPNRKFVSQWTNIYFHGTTVQMGTFQIILYEGSNEVQIQYRDLLGNASQPSRELGNSATIGIRKDNTHSNQYSHNTASITQGQAIRYTPSGANTYTVDTSADYDLIYLAPEGAPTSPTLVTPTDGSTGVTLTPSFEWLPVESATSYRVLISTVSNFSTTVVDQTTSGTSYTHGSNLNTSTQYYWRVQSINSNGSSLSPTRSFTTAAVSNTAPDVPTDVESAGLLNGASITSMTGQTISMELSDDDDDEQIRYRLQIATDAAFNSLVVDYRSSYGSAGPATYTFGQSGGTYLVGNSGTVLSDDEYYVRLRAEDDSAASSSWYGSGSVAFTLEQNIAPDAPSSLGGAELVDGSVSSEAQPNFTFTLSDDNGSNTVKYEIHIDDSADFASPVLQYSSALAAQGSRSFTVGQAVGSGVYSVGEAGQVLADGSYYWRVRAIDLVGDASSYTVAHGGEIAFVINSNVPSINGIEATALSASSVHISWETDEMSSSQVEYGLVTSYGFETSRIDLSPRVTEHEVLLSDLQTCARYFYRVKSVNNASTETVSSRNTFTTTGCSTSAVVGGSEATVALEGGSLEYAHDASTARLVIPASFASEGAHFQINILDTTTTPAPPATMGLAGGNIFNLVALTESGVYITEFNEPVTFSIIYPESMKEEFQASTLDVYKYNPDAESWEKKNCSNDLSTNTITCTLPSFSVYGVFGQAKEGATSGSSTEKRVSGKRSCDVSAVITSPDLFQIDAQSSAAILYFVPSSGGAKEYIIEYGTTSDANQHAVRFSHADTSGAVSYTIDHLAAQATWYFRVRGTNGCAFSAWSNTKSSFIGVRSNPASMEKAVVTEEVKEAEALPSNNADQTTQQTSYTVRVKVTQAEQPAKNVKVVLAQTQQEVVTDDEGYAIFEQVIGGLHRLQVVGQAYAAEKEVEISGDDPEFDVAINLVLHEDGISTRTWLSIVAVLLAGFSITLFMSRRKKGV